MKKIIIGGLVAAVLFFGFSMVMWMGGMHSDFSKKTVHSDSMLKHLNAVYTENGVYMIPWHDPTIKRTAEEEKAMMAEMDGKPSAMIVYNKNTSMNFGAMMAKGLLFALIIGFMAAWVLQTANISVFRTRFFVCFSFAIFAVITGVLTEMNWWAMPLHFAKAALIDILGGWALASLWMAWYMKRVSS